MSTSWCPQEEIQKQSIHQLGGGGCGLMHSGWNSTLESVCYGVPVVS